MDGCWWVGTAGQKGERKGPVLKKHEKYCVCMYQCFVFKIRTKDPIFIVFCVFTFFVFTFCVFVVFLSSYFSHIFEYYILIYMPFVYNICFVSVPKISYN